MEVVDVSGVLSRLGELPQDEATLVGLAEGAAGRWELLALPVGQGWSPEREPSGGWSVLVLEGVATWRVGETRQTLASGHLLLVPPGAPVRATNDGVCTMSALVHQVASAGGSPAALIAERRAGD